MRNRITIDSRDEFIALIREFTLAGIRFDAWAYEDGSYIVEVMGA